MKHDFLEIPKQGRGGGHGGGGPMLFCFDR